MKGKFTQNYNAAKVVLASRGPDEIKKTADDVAVTYSLCNSQDEWGEDNGGPNAGGDAAVAGSDTEYSDNDTVTATVTIENVSGVGQSVILASIGIPPGFDLIADKLDALLAEEGTFLQKYETTPRQIILYINHLAAGKTVSLSYDLLARYPIEGNTGESSVCPYYNNPQEKDQIEGQTLTITE